MSSEIQTTSLLHQETLKLNFCLRKLSTVLVPSFRLQLYIHIYFMFPHLLLAWFLSIDRIYNRLCSFEKGCVLLMSIDDNKYHYNNKVS